MARDLAPISNHILFDDRVGADFDIAAQLGHAGNYRRLVNHRRLKKVHLGVLNQIEGFQGSHQLK